MDSKEKLVTSFRNYFGVYFVLAGVYAALSNLLQFSGPLMINRILIFLNQDEENKEPISNGIIYVSILVFCFLIKTLIYGHALQYLQKCSTKMLNSANSLIFHKILNLSSSSRKYLEAGSILNHINVDVMSFYYFLLLSTYLFSGPVMILGAIILLVIEVGWIGLIAPVFFAFGMIIQNKITKKGLELRKDQLFWTDKRTKCVN